MVAGVGVVGRLGADVWNVISVDTWSSQGAVFHLKRMLVKPTSGISTCAMSVRILTTLVARASTIIVSCGRYGKRLFVHWCC